LFYAIHFTTIRFVVISQQMQHAMQNQHAQLAVQRPPIFLCVPPRHTRRNGDVSQVRISFVRVFLLLCAFLLSSPLFFFRGNSSAQFPRRPQNKP